jgi:hypothetical protein
MNRARQQEEKNEKKNVHKNFKWRTEWTEAANGTELSYTNNTHPKRKHLVEKEFQLEWWCVKMSQKTRMWTTPVEEK